MFYMCVYIQLIQKVITAKVEKCSIFRIKFECMHVFWYLKVIEAVVLPCFMWCVCYVDSYNILTVINLPSILGKIPRNFCLFLQKLRIFFQNEIFYSKYAEFQRI